MRKVKAAVVPASTASSHEAVDQSFVYTGFSNTSESAAWTLRKFYVEQLPVSVVIVPFGHVPIDNILFSLVFVVLGSLYGMLLRRTIGRVSIQKKSSNANRLHRTLPGPTKSASGVVVSGASPGKYKEEVFEFMDTCADVRKSLRKVQDPDQVRAQKFQHLKEHSSSHDNHAPLPGGSEHNDESSSSSHHLVEMCLDVRKGLQKVQDPDEARKLKLQHLKEMDLTRSTAEIAKQHQQAGVGRTWIQ